MKKLSELKDLQGKKVLVRVDFNVPLGSDGVVGESESWRIDAAIPTIKYLIERKACVILMTHLGRPDGEIVDEFRLDPIQKRLSYILGISVLKTSDCIGDFVYKTIRDMQEGEVLLLENLRFHKEEEENDSVFAKKLADFADIYVNDAFSVSHRAHASVEAITNFLPSYAGLSLEKEIENLSKVIENPEKPATMIIGGLKAETKLPVINFLLEKFDNVLIGGVVANFLFKANGIEIGNSVLDDLDIAEAKKIDITNSKIHIPSDVITDNPDKRNVDLENDTVGDFRILDLGENTLKEYCEIIRSSKTVIWNGTVGMFEDENYANGTREIARAMTESYADTIIGGGDTIFALDKFKYLDRMKHISTGGGAMLEFLSGKKLPGIEALNKY
jgi:3-phosphoglycerate kinase